MPASPITMLLNLIQGSSDGLLPEKLRTVPSRMNDMKDHG